jgi:Zn-finger nucleic acid-binding protein
MDFDLWKEKGEFRVDTEPVSCPKCQTTSMNAIHFDEINGNIHHCLLCRGSWLRAVDFNNMIQELRKEAIQKKASEYFQLSLEKASDLLTHPENLVSEWQDLKAVLRLLNYRFFVEHPKLRSFLEGLHKSFPV